jgi:hypothetical protein
VAFSPDGTALASIAYENAARLWDLVTGRERFVLHPAQDPSETTAIACSPDGKILATGSSKGLIHLWDIATGDELLVLRGQVRVTSLAFSPDGTLAAAGWDGSAQLWDTVTGRSLGALPTGTTFLFQAVFSPDGKTLAMTGMDGMVQLWDIESRRQTASLHGHQKRVLGAAFSPDGRRLATAGEDGTARLWDLATGLELLTLSEPGYGLYGVTFSRDGRRLASAAYLGSNQSKVLLWDASEVTPELRARREVAALLRFLIDRVASRAELLERIERDATIPESVRAVSLQQAGPFWQARVLRHAEATVATLFSKLMLHENAIDRIQRDPALDAEVRQAALRLAATWPESASALNAASWDVAARPNAGAAEYRLALHQAERACRLEPENGAYLNTLGVAQYRNRLYSEALATLTRSNQRNQASQPSDLVFLAMTRCQLGQVDSAHEELAKLREAIKRLQPGEKSDENRAFLREAEGLLLDASFPADPFAP